MATVLRSPVLAILLLATATLRVGPAVAFGSGPNADAPRLIDEAQAKWRELPGYVATSRRTRGGITAFTTMYVRRLSEGESLVRVERSLSPGGAPGKARLVLLQNHDGGWRFDGKRAAHMGAMPPLERRLPSRLSTAQVLRLGVEVEYTIERDVEWFGHRCTRIRAALPADAIAAVRQRLADKIALEDAPAPIGGVPPMLGDGRRRAIGLPVAHVYLIDQATGVILSWQSIGYTGETVAEVSYQDFRIEAALADKLFAVPAGYKVVEDASDPGFQAVTTPSASGAETDDGGSPSATGEQGSETTVSAARVYSFQGTRRLSWPFGTPNQLALAGAVALMLSLGWVIAARDRRAATPTPRHRTRAALAASVALAGAAACVTAATYSRGALVGVVAGTLAMVFLHRRGRGVVLGGLAFYLAVCALLPAGAERIASLARAWDEGSIANRFVVWKGALAMMWDHPLRGVGFGGFRETYAAWYQPAHMRGVYLTALNDLLTVGACAGIPALWAGCVAIVLVTALGLDALRKRPAGWLAGLIGAWIACVAAAQFSSFAAKWETAWIPLALTLGIVGVCAWLAVKRPETARSSQSENGTARRTRRTAWLALGSGTALTLGIVALAAGAGQSFPRRPHIARTMETGKVSAAITVEPQAADAARGWALVVTDDWAPERDARRLFRGLAAAGFRTRAWRPDDLGFTGVEELRRKLQEIAALRRSGEPILLIGLGAAGRVALAAASGGATSPSAVVTLGARAWFALPELSPLENVRRLRCPLFVVHDASDAAADVGDARQLAAAAGRAGLAVEVATLDSASPTSSAQSPIVEAIVRFIDAGSRQPTEPQT